MRPARHLVIFARFPQAGAGKRRLAADIGAVAAVRFQRVRLAILTARLARDPRWTTWLAATPLRAPGRWPGHLRLVPQGRGNLGERMGGVMRMLPPGPAVIIGTDIPSVGRSHVARAFHALAGADAVFGPAADGGYWLVGLRRTPKLRLPFAPVRWSSEHALADTMRNLPDARIVLVDRLGDVDDAASLHAQPHWARLCARP